MLWMFGIGQNLIDGFRSEKLAAHGPSQAQRTGIRCDGVTTLRLHL